MIVGPWAHGKLVEIQYPANSRAPSDVKSLDAMAFFDHHLKGADNGVASDKPVHYYVMGDPTNAKAPGNFWRAADNWPPPSNPAKFYFRTNHKLVRGKMQTAAAKLTYKYDPKNPVPTIGGQNMIIDRGPMDQRRIESRDDVVVFTTDELSAPVEVTGRIQSHIYVSSNCPDTDFTVKLCDVYPDGRSMIVTDGILRARFRKSFAKKEFLKPGEVTAVGRNEVTPLPARARDMPLSAAAPPIALWPPQPCTWTSM